MKKLLLFIVTLFICSNAYALESANIDLYITNPNGVEITIDSTKSVIPYQTKVKLLEEVEDKDIVQVEYNGSSVSIKKTDLKPVEETFKDIQGYKLDKPETVKIFSSQGLVMYKGPNSTFYEKINKVIPKDTEITYNYIDNKDNTFDKYAYVTYDGDSGWVLLDLTNEAVAQKLDGKIKVLNPSNIELKDAIKGNKIENTIVANDVLSYSYVTRYQYNVELNGQSVWLSITNASAIATHATIGSITLNVGDMIYAKPNITRSTGKIETARTVTPLFYYNGFYYIEFDNTTGWVKIDNSINTEKGFKIDITEKKIEEPIKVEEPVKEEKPKKMPTRVELIIIIGLAVILLLSLTSLVAVVMMNKKNVKKLQKNTEESTNSENNS